MTSTDAEAKLSPDYAGTGLSFCDLMQMGRDERNELLARVIEALHQQIDPLKARLEDAELMFKSDFFEHGGSLRDAGEYEVTKEDRWKWVYDLEGLSQLQRYVPPAVWDRCFTPTVEVHKAELNKLKKMGTEIKEIIDQNCIQQVTGTSIVVKRKKRVVERDQPMLAYGKTEHGDWRKDS